MHTVRKIREEDTPNADWSHPLTYSQFAVGSVTGSGSITLTGGNGAALGTAASYTPPPGTVPNSGGKTLGPAPPSGSNNVTDVVWDGTNLSFSYNGYSYVNGKVLVSVNGTQIQGTITLPDPSVIQKNWTATQ